MGLSVIVCEVVFTYKLKTIKFSATPEFQLHLTRRSRCLIGEARNEWHFYVCTLLSYYKAKVGGLRGVWKWKLCRQLTTIMSQAEPLEKHIYLHHSVLGSATAGIISRLLCHPIDTCKAKLQFTDAKIYSGAWFLLLTYKLCENYSMHFILLYKKVPWIPRCKR